MGTTITKVKRPAKKEEVALKKSTKVDAGAMVADEYGMAKERMENEATPVVKAFEKAKDKLKAFMAANYDATEEVKLTGELFELEVGACANAPMLVKEGGLKLVRDMVGEETFFQIAKVNLEDLRSYLTPEQLAEVLVDPDPKYTEKRSIKVAKIESV